MAIIGKPFTSQASFSTISTVLFAGESDRLMVLFLKNKIDGCQGSATEVIKDQSPSDEKTIDSGELGIPKLWTRISYQ
jgi:hypothetical protein